MKILMFVLCMFTLPVAFATSAIKIIVPYAVGGPNDSAARIIQPALSQALSRPVVVVNRPGAGGLVGVVSAVQADSNENVLFLPGATAILSGLAATPLPFTEDQFVPISYIGTMDYMLVSTPKFGVKSLKEWRKINPSQPIMMGSAGTGSGTEIITKSFNRSMNKNIVFVPYKGIAPMFSDVLAGNVDAAFVAGTMSHESIKHNKLLAVATTSPTRLPEFPNVPTMREMGVTGIVNLGWLMVFSNKNNDPVLVKNIEQKLAIIMKDPDIIKKLNQVGINASPIDNSPAGFFKSEINKFVKFDTK